MLMNLQVTAVSVLLLWQSQFVFSKASSDGNDYFVPGTLKLHFRTHSTKNGLLSVPWISSSTSLRISPICYDEILNQKETGARLAHVVCRHAGFMVATKWHEVINESLFSNSTGVSVYCRGDEQFIDQCQILQTYPMPCNQHLAVECGDCSHSYMVKAVESQLTLGSPGFPVYIPMVVCEWNITLPIGSNLFIQFEQFELPSPVYDETTNAVSCRSGYLDVMSWHEDISKMILDGRFCGRYSPGNLTILSNRILIRFTAGPFKIDEISKKGLLAKCSIAPQAHSSSPLAIVRWALIGSALIFSAVMALCIWIWKRNLYQYSQRFCFCWCWANSSSVSHVRNMDLPRSPFSSEVLPSTRLPPLNLLSSEFEEHSQQRFESLYGRNEAELKFSRQNCDSRHFEQTRRLEKLRSAQQRKRSSAELVSMRKIAGFTKGFPNSSSVNATNDKDGSHIYEDIDVGLQYEYKKSFGCSGGFPCSQMNSPETTTKKLPLISRTIGHYEPVCLASRQTLSGGEQTSSTLASRTESISHNHPSLIQDLVSSSMYQRSNSTSPSYFPTSSDSASFSAIYINPEPDSTSD